MVLWEYGKNIQYCGRREAEDKRSSCDCFGGRKRMLRMHVENDTMKGYQEVLRGQVRQMAERFGFSLWQPSLPSPPPYLPWPDPTLNIALWVLQLGDGNKWKGSIKYIILGTIKGLRIAHSQQRKPSENMVPVAWKSKSTCCVRSQRSDVVSTGRSYIHSFTPWNVCWMSCGGWRFRLWIPVQWDIV